MSVTCTHVATDSSLGVCPACADRAQRAGVEWAHAEVWRMIEEIADSAWRDGKLPAQPDLAMAEGIRETARMRRETHEDYAQRIEQGK